MDDIFWLDNVSAAESSTTDPTSIFAPIADADSGSFEDLVDPALFCSLGSTSRPSSSEPS